METILKQKRQEMIEEISFSVAAEARTSFDYIADLPSVRQLGGKISFKPGLNIIVGPNGSGKTSILKAIAHHMGAEHSGYSGITKKWVWSVTWLKDDEGNEIPYSPISLKHDGQPVVYADPRKTPGFINSGVDEEFSSLGAVESMHMSQESSGEQSNRRITPFTQILLGKAPFPEGYSDHIDIRYVNDVWKHRVSCLLSNWMAGTIPKGQPTVLLDEPESGLGLMNQILLWARILKNPEISNKFQIILVSHNNQSLNVDGANYIELRPGYLDACRKLSSGELSFEEASVFATKMSHKLSKRELSVLKSIRDAEGGFPVTKSIKTCERLVELDLIRSYKKRLPAVVGRRSRDRKSEYFYCATEKASQLLDIQLSI